MQQITKFFSNILTWARNHMVGIIFACLVLMYMLGTHTVLEAKTQTGQKAVECEALCFPQQSEYITNANVMACWCYVDQNSMKKAQ